MAQHNQDSILEACPALKTRGARRRGQNYVLWHFTFRKASRSWWMLLCTTSS